MPVWIILLRGINVGGHHQLPMKEPIRDLQSINISNAQTYIQSGNVVSRSRHRSGQNLSTSVSSVIEQHHGFRPDVIAMTADQFEQLIANNPLRNLADDPKMLHYYFLATAPEHPDIESLQQLQAGGETFHLTDDVLYLFAPNGIGRSKLAAKIESALGVSATARNQRTVLKLLGMAQQI